MAFRFEEICISPSCQRVKDHFSPHRLLRNKLCRRTSFGGSLPKLKWVALDLGNDIAVRSNDALSTLPDNDYPLK
jgi:hypothetical protein